MKVRPKSTWETSHTVIYDAPFSIFIDYSMNNSMHYFNWLWDWNWKATIVFITIQWVTGNKQRILITMWKLKMKLINLKNHNENKYESAVYLIN